MQNSARLEVSGDNMSTTVYSHRLSSSHGSPEDSISDHRSYMLPHHSESLQDPGPQMRSYVGRPDYDPSGEGLMASTERSSSTYVSLDQPGSFGDPTEPHIGPKSSSSRLTVKQEESNGSPRQRHVHLFRHWRWEILSIVSSLGLLAGILVTLAKYDRGTQPEWPYHININSLISVLTAVIIAQLAFILAEIISQLKWFWFRQPHPLQDLEHYDAASRGILGSIIFMGRFFRHPRAFLAVGAAFIFLMSAAIGPFTQQSIKSYACPRPLHNITASIPTANYVNSSLIVGRSNPKHRYPDLEMMTAALEGLVGSGNGSKQVPVDCPTGNCDFAPYSSLAYCSSCADITARVQEQYGPRYNDPEMFEWNYTLPGEDCQLAYSDHRGHPQVGTKSATGSTPHHLVICSSQLDFRHRSATSFTILSMSWANCSRDHDDGSPNSPGCGDYPDQLPSLSNTAGLVAMNCTLGLCLRDYTGRVSNGVLDETTTSSLSSSLTAEEGYGFRILKLPCTVDSETYDISNISQVPRIPGRNFTSIAVDGQNVTAPLECVFNTDDDVPWAISEFLEGGLFDPREAPLDDGAVCGLNSIDGTSYCDPWYLEPLFHGGRPTAKTFSSDMDGVAVAISNRMRAVGSNAYQNGSGAALGTVIQTAVCVHVDWPWLIFPSALVLLTTVLFIAVLMMARYSQVDDGPPIWKSSAVVGFFNGIGSASQPPVRPDGDPARHGVPGQELGIHPSSTSLLKGESHKDLMTLKSMHAKAKKVVVKLETAGTGQHGFVVVNEEEDGRLMDYNEHLGQRRSTDSRCDGRTLPLTRLPSNDSLEEQRPAYLHVDLGTGPTPSIRSSLDRPFGHGF